MVRLGLWLLLVVVLGSCGRAPAQLGNASWIWAPSLAVAKARELGVVFVRDFELSSTPATAQLRLRAGDGLVVWVNGTRVAATATADRCTVAGFALDGLLREGANRLAVEVRSEGHFGGMIGCVVVDGACVVPTDSRWRLEPAADPALVMGWRVAAGEPAHEIAPGYLGSRCLQVVETPSLSCLGPGEDLAIQQQADGSVRLETGTVGLVELRYLAAATGEKIRIETAKITWEAPALAGAVATLDPIVWEAGEATVAGIGIDGARLWPWNAACGPQPSPRPVMLPTLFDLSPRQGLVEVGGGTGAKL